MVRVSSGLASAPGRAGTTGSLGEVRRAHAPMLMPLLAGALLLSACTPAASELSRADATATRPATVPVPTSGVLRARIAGTDRSAPAASRVPADHVLLVGDSVLALVTDDLARRTSAVLHVDAADCRRIDRAVSGPCGGVPTGATVRSGLDAVVDAMAALRADATVPGTAVVVLANNSSLDAGLLDATMDALEGVDRVWWVNARIVGVGRQDENNRLLADLARRHPRAGVVDWYSASEDQDWLADHVHPDETGQRAFARLVADHLACDCDPAVDR